MYISSKLASPVRKELVRYTAGARSERPQAQGREQSSISAHETVSLRLLEPGAARQDKMRCGAGASLTAILLVSIALAVAQAADETAPVIIAAG